jgi:glycine betaine/choline ABC-type transport system substrate-binding protein
MDLGLLFQALESKSVDMVAANATDGMLLSMDVKVLQDDKQAFPPYEAAIVVRLDTLEAIPALRNILSRLSGRISEEAMRKLNYEVDGKKRQAAEVAVEWLKSAALGS